MERPMLVLFYRDVKGKLNMSPASTSHWKALEAFKDAVLMEASIDAICTELVELDDAEVILQKREKRDRLCKFLDFVIPD